MASPSSSSAAYHRYDHWLTQARTYEADWRKDNITSYDYYDGAQWTEDEIEVLEDRGQQATVMNVVRPTVDMLLGLEKQVRSDLAVVGRGEDDFQMGTVLTEMLKQVWDDSDYDYYQSLAFREAVVGGRGWLGLDVTTDDSGRDVLTVEQLPWEEFYVDPFFRKPDASDARYIIRQVWMDMDEVREKWPDCKEELATTHSAFMDDFAGIEQSAQETDDSRSMNKYFDAKHGRVGVCETWYKDADETVHYCVYVANVFLEGSEDGENPNPYKVNEYPMIPITTFRDRDGRPYGIVRLVKPIQDMINKENSKYIWNVSANRIMTEDDATDDLDQLRAEWNRPDGTAIVKDINKVRTEDNMRESTMLLQHMDFLLMMLQRTSGINDSLLGLGATNERSAQQQSQRIAQGSQMQNQIIENVMLAKKNMARLTLKFVAAYYSDERVVRIMSPNGNATFYSLNVTDPETGEVTNAINDYLRYDVVLTYMPPFNTQREMIMRMFTEVAKSLGGAAPDFVFKVMLQHSDLPNKTALIGEWEQMMAQQQAAEAQAQGEAMAQQSLPG